MEENQCECCESEENEEEGECGLKEIIISAVLFAAGLVVSHLDLSFLNGFLGKIGEKTDASLLLSGILFLIAYLVCGKGVVIGAFKNIFKGQVFDEKFLMSVASLGAVFLREFPEAVGVMLFYQIGEYFQDRAVDKSRDSINALMEIRPDKANVIRNGQEIEVAAVDVKIGETIVVKPGERIPIDGKIVKGSSFMDNSALTGESVPLEVMEGDSVYSGAINKDSVLQIVTTKAAGDSAAARILKLVQQSSEKKTKTERFITRFSKVYTPVVCILALSVAVLVPTVLKFAFPAVFAEYGYSTWVQRGLIFLVVSCPCAIVISVPLTFFGGIGAAGKLGILVKGSSAIEGLSRIKLSVFDKTGTLTKGVFVVSEIHSANPEKFPEQELLAIAAHAETYSNHPAAVSLREAHHAECCAEAKITDAHEIPGHGIEVTLNGQKVLAGNSRLMLSKNVKGFKECPEAHGGTVIHIAVEGEYAGHIVISDETKEDAAKAVSELHKAGVKEVVMLTGDNETSAFHTASEIGIDKVFANLLPEDKVGKVEELLKTLESNGKKRGYLSFTGDGINDAPVLARSDVGVAMGALGSDAAIESADVVIMNDEPSKLAKAIRIGKKTMSVAYQNIIFSLLIKVAIMILGTLGFANMWIAVFGDTGVALLAILNAMRALIVKRN